MRIEAILTVALAIALSRSVAIGAETSPASPNPIQQSDCEIQANRYKAQHPHIDSSHFLISGFIWFEDAVPPSPPQSFRDEQSGVTFYVESDGRHIAAIDSNGKILWIRNPFVDRNLCPYRSAHPYIYWIGPPGGTFGRHFIGPFTPTPDATANAKIVNLLRGNHLTYKVTPPDESDRFIGIAFNSSQIGYVDMRNGDFYGMGQD